MCRASFLLAVLATAAAQQPLRLKTDSGVEFAISGRKSPAPAPVILLFAGSIDQTLAPEYYRLGERLRDERGFLEVTVDIPCHGADRRPGEAAAMAGWRARIEKGENTIAAFTAKVTSVIDYLIAEGYADSKRIFASGRSRGGFLALHAAAADPRIKAVIDFAPVTELTALQEFSGMWNHAPTRALSALHLAPRLAGRPVWICIGNNDDRVGTAYAIELSRRLVEAALSAGAEPDVELWVQPSKGHSTAPDSQDRAAAWLMARTEAR
jgi:dienelactone hydrolase